MQSHFHLLLRVVEAVEVVVVGELHSGWNVLKGKQADAVDASTSPLLHLAVGTATVVHKTGDVAHAVAVDHPACGNKTN